MFKQNQINYGFYIGYIKFDILNLWILSSDPYLLTFKVPKYEFSYILIYI